MGYASLHPSYENQSSEQIEMSIKVLIVDDSALMRKYLREVFAEDKRFVIDTARDGKDALEHIAAFNPDVITLDINMPIMDGLTCLSHIMTNSPKPVVMVSSLTEKGALATFEALELGAVDYIPKPDGTVSHNIRQVGHLIREKVHAASQIKMRRSVGLKNRIQQEQKQQQQATRAAPSTVRTEKKSSSVSADGLILVGVSTGGPNTLEIILTALPADFPYPILVAQHMPSRFTSVFAERLNKICKLEVKEVSRPTPLLAGEVLIGRGDADVVVSTRNGKPVALCVPSDENYLWHPSVERMVKSAMEHYAAEQLIAVELTGMGNDGAFAMTSLHEQGGRTIAESEESAIVFGMPQALIEKGGADKVLHINRIAGQLMQWL